MAFKIPTGVQGKAATWTNETRTVKSPGDGNPIKVSVLEGGIKTPHVIGIASDNRSEETWTQDKMALDVFSVMERKVFKFLLSFRTAQTCGESGQIGYWLFN